MIAAADVTAWSLVAPWPTPAQVEQDLLLSRTLIEIYQDPLLKEELVFRGGTCLHKLHLAVAQRYSEDLDFVRSTEGGIAPITQALTAIGHRLGFDVSTKIGQQPKVYMRTTAADGSKLRLKVEMNTHERSPALPLIQVPHRVESPWWSGHANVTTFAPAELIATKIRALYQRKKGRDLFDIWLALTEIQLDPKDILAAYATYGPPGLNAKKSERDLREKLSDPAFRADLQPLVVPWPVGYDLDAAGEFVIARLLARIPAT